MEREEARLQRRALGGYQDQNDDLSLGAFLSSLLTLGLSSVFLLLLAQTVCGVSLLLLLMRSLCSGHGTFLDGTTLRASVAGVVRWSRCRRGRR